MKEVTFIEKVVEPMIRFKNFLDSEPTDKQLRIAFAIAVAMPTAAACWAMSTILARDILHFLAK